MGDWDTKPLVLLCFLPLVPHVPDVWNVQLDIERINVTTSQLLNRMIEFFNSSKLSNWSWPGLQAAWCKMFSWEFEKFSQHFQAQRTGQVFFPTGLWWQHAWLGHLPVLCGIFPHMFYWTKLALLRSCSLQMWLHRKISSPSWILLMEICSQNDRGKHKSNVVFIDTSHKNELSFIFSMFRSKKRHVRNSLSTF